MFTAPEIPSQTSGIEEDILELAAHLDAATHRFLSLIHRYDESGDWAGVGIRSCAHWLAWACGLAPGAARERVRVARALGGLPQIDEALSKGLISYSKVRALTRVATADNETKLLYTAKACTAAQLERVCRGVAMAERDDGPVTAAERWVRQTRGDGELVRIQAQLHPDEAALVMQAIDEIRRRARHAPGDVPAEMRPETGESPGVSLGNAPAEDVPEETPPRVPRFSRADALVKAADLLLSLPTNESQTAEPKRTGGDRVTIFVHFKESEVLEKPTATLDDGTRVSTETFRRIACDTGLIAVSNDDSGTPHDIGRKTRSISPALRRALTLRDRTCSFPGCDCQRGLDAHHVEHWLHGGETKLGNLTLLCGFHHRLVHEGGFSVELGGAATAGATGDREGPRFLDPEGHLIALVPKAALAPDRALLDLRAANENAGAQIAPETSASEWRGERPDYEYMVARLV